MVLASKPVYLPHTRADSSSTIYSNKPHRHCSFLIPIIKPYNKHNTSMYVMINTPITHHNACFKAYKFRNVQPAVSCKCIYHPQNAFTIYSVVGVLLVCIISEQCIQ